MRRHLQPSGGLYSLLVNLTGSYTHLHSPDQHVQSLPINFDFAHITMHLLSDVYHYLLRDDSEDFRPPAAVPLDRDHRCFTLDFSVEAKVYGSSRIRFIDDSD